MRAVWSVGMMIPERRYMTMDIWEAYKQDCLYNDDGPIDMSCWDKPTARRIPPGNRNNDSAKLEKAVFLWAYRSMGLLGAVLLFV